MTIVSIGAYLLIKNGLGKVTLLKNDNRDLGIINPLSQFHTYQIL